MRSKPWQREIKLPCSQASSFCFCRLILSRLDFQLLTHNCQLSILTFRSFQQASPPLEKRLLATRLKSAIDRQGADPATTRRNCGARGTGMKPPGLRLRGPLSSTEKDWNKRVSRPKLGNEQQRRERPRRKSCANGWEGVAKLHRQSVRIHPRQFLLAESAPVSCVKLVPNKRGASSCVIVPWFALEAWRARTGGPLVGPQRWNAHQSHRVKQLCALMRHRLTTSQRFWKC